MKEDSVKAIPLFPLNSIVFPKGKLSLQIFETRYVDMVRTCMRENHGFGVILIETGSEVAYPGMKLNIHRVGTYCEIIDWNQLPSGLLGITVEGKCTFEIVDSWRESNDLCIGEVKLRSQDSQDADPVDVGNEFSEYVELLRSLVKHPAVESLTEDIKFDNLREISWRLSELLPISNKEKQTLLELEDPLIRLEQVELYMASLNK